MQIRFLTISILLSLICGAAIGQTKSVDDYRSMSTFCSLEGSKLNWRKSPEEANQVKNLNRCKISCNTAADVIEQGLDHPQLKNNMLVCDTSFADLPASISAKYTAHSASKAKSLYTESELKALADECSALAKQYPHMSSNNLEPNFLKCISYCKRAAKEVAQNSIRQRDKILLCERNYTGAEARLAP